MSPDEHAVGIAVILGNVRFHPLEHGRDIFRAIVPGRTSMALHIDAHHTVLGRPSGDVVVEGVRFLVLKFYFVAHSAGNINQHWPGRRAFIRRENIHYIPGIGAERLISRDCDSGVQGRRVAVDIVRGHHRPVQLRRAGRVNDMAHLDQFRLNVRGYLGFRHPGH